MKKFRIIYFVLVLLLLSITTTQAQIVDFKKWKDTYPEMNGTYPLTFIAFSGWLIPVPHVFIRTWPTHYYMEVGALPVSDATEMTGQTKTGLMRIVAKMLERHQMKGRHEETTGIKINTDFQKQIEDKLFSARSEQLQDLFQLSHGFIQLYKKVDNLGHLSDSKEVRKIFQKESDQLLLRFLMVNLFNSEHGDKLEAFSEISATLNKLLGEVDYTYSKIHFFSNYDKELISYSFLTQ
ncbi:hypothetical protein [uncultured Draconibacterium sp.]|uniref:hypothetical protein n=1 Tax=uncultured Draconibacterium sp. TaxID=1573823 RepID=UPI003216DCF3